MGLDMAGLDPGDGDDRRHDEVRYVYPVGRQVDRFTAGEEPGPGARSSAAATPSSAISTTASPSWSNRPRCCSKTRPSAWQLHVEYPAGGMQLWRSWGNRYLWLRLTGPGRVGLQSSYDRLEDPGTDFLDSCQYTQHLWP